MLTRRETTLLQRIGAEINAREEEVCLGGLTPEQYKDLTGFIRGLKLASAFMLEVDKEEG